MREERLQKVLAAAGVASRRACEELIAEGRVKVNGQVVTELGTKVDPSNVQIQVDGKPVHMSKRHQYVKLHKPRGILSDIGGDTGDRETVANLLPPDSHRLFPVGRLDLHSEGLMLLTDDGELAHKLTHPRYEHTKTYYVLVETRPTDLALNQLRQGIDLPEGRTAPAAVRVVNQLPAELKLSKGPMEGVWLEIILREGKKRQIRHMTAAVGYPTLRLVRWAIGPLTLGDVKLREVRHLSQREVAALRTLVGLAQLPNSQRSTAPSGSPSARARTPNRRAPRSPGSRTTTSRNLGQRPRPSTAKRGEPRRSGNGGRAKGN
ncbi:MAG: rRNA pseudouridine synthase [Caldilineaceae bacterium]|nr:rRNA pseudouridine synthase [Caldilineaceae bacterium]